MKRLILCLALSIWVLVPGFGSTPNWEVAVLFLGGQEPPEYQNDIDQNIIELARMPLKIKLGILREFPDRVVEYFPDANSSNAVAWDSLFANAPVKGVQIPGSMRASNRVGSSVLDNPRLLQKFFKSVFKSASSNRVLIVYGHGEGFKGLRVMPLLQFQDPCSMPPPFLYDLFLKKQFSHHESFQLFLQNHQLTRHQ